MKAAKGDWVKIESMEERKVSKRMRKKQGHKLRLRGHEKPSVRFEVCEYMSKCLCYLYYEGNDDKCVSQPAS